MFRPSVAMRLMALSSAGSISGTVTDSEIKSAGGGLGDGLSKRRRGHQDSQWTMDSMGKRDSAPGEAAG